MKMKEIIYHQLNINNEYNFGMGRADIADQINIGLTTGQEILSGGIQFFGGVYKCLW